MTRALLTALLAACCTVLVISFPQLGDPLIRFDDYPAFFGDEALYYEKTLAEGRWLNYWWMSRETLWPSTVAFLVYQSGWAVFAAAAAVNALGTGARRSDTAILAALIALSPQAFLISGWFNTLTLGVWLPAGFAVATLFLSAKASCWLFLVAAPVSMLTYSTYPLLMMGVLLTRHGLRRGFGGLVLLMMVLAASIVLGMLLIYAINWYAHGVFGMQLADWREPTPASDLTSLSVNLATLPEFFERLFLSMGFGQVLLGILNAALLAGALALLALRRPAEAGYIAAGLIASVALMIAHSLKSGVEIPVRALVVVWVYFAIALMRAVQIGLPAGRARAATAGLLVLAAVFAGHLVRHARFLADWQAETRALAARFPKSTGRIVVYGQYDALPSAANADILHHLSLAFRLRQLTKLTAVNCGDPLAECAFVPPFDPDASQPGEVLVTEANGIVFVRLPKPGKG